MSPSEHIVYLSCLAHDAWSGESAAAADSCGSGEATSPVNEIQRLVSERELRREKSLPMNAQLIMRDEAR